MMLPILDPVEGGSSATSAELDELILGELWVSFISLVRSHLGALQTTGKLAQAHFIELSRYKIEVVDLARTLHVSLVATSGEGEWSLRRMGEMIAAGSWLLLPDATATIDRGRIQDMEFAVEAFVEKLWTRSSRAAGARDGGGDAG